MDRVNRSLLIASTLLAIPAALLMASLSDGQSPDVQLAVGLGAKHSNAIQQVANQQTSERQTRPGLIQVLAGAAGRGSENHQHHNMSNTPSKGLLDTLFSRSSNGGDPSNKRTTHSSQHTHHAPTGNPHAAPVPSSQPDWSGVPYHTAEASNQVSKSIPLRDPGHPSLAAEDPNTRIIRGGSSRTLQAVPASSRRPGESTYSSRPSSMMPLPTPPQEESSVMSGSESLSSSTSSRRSTRRNVEALSTSESVSQPSANRQGVASNADVADLVPRVTRKPIDNEPPKQGVAATGPVSTNSKSGVSRVLTDAKSSGTDTSVQEKVSEVPAPPADAQREPAVAVPKRSTPTPSLAVTPSEGTPAKLSAAPLPHAEAPPELDAAPAATLGTPASTVSHRSGPPSQAFVSDDIKGVSENDGSKQTNPTNLNAASDAVGSAIATNGDVASYRHASQPVYEIAKNSESTTDPYRPATDRSGRKMSTNGVSVPSLERDVAPTNPLNVPVQPIRGYAAQDANKLSGDGFSPSIPDGRNQMREAMPGSNSNASTSELPGIRVTTIGPGAIMIRQTSQYEIRVENRGAIDASGVMVRALIPDWADIRGQNATRGDIDNQTQGSTDRLVWSIDQLPAGASETMYVRLTASRSGTYDLDVDWTMLPQKSTSKVQVREPRLDLTIEGPEEVIYGQSQTYKVRVLNPGDGTAPNVVFTLSPNSATPQTQRIGDIPPGKEAQFDVELTAQDLGDLKIHGLASGELELRAEAEKTIRVAAAKLEAVLSGPEVKYQNTEAMYSLQIQNNGTATSERVVANLRLPSGAKYLGGIEDAVQEGAGLRWELNALAPGANRNYQFRCNMGSTGDHLFVFDCKGTAAGNASVSISTRVESIADLVLTVSDPVAPAPIGTDVTYEIVIRNRGSKEATDVRAIAQFSHGIEPKRIEGQSGEVMTGQVLFDPIPRIGAGQEVRLKVTAQADRAGHHRFRTEVRSGDTVLVAEEATHYMSPKGDRVSRRSSENATR